MNDMNRRLIIVAAPAALLSACELSPTELYRNEPQDAYRRAPTRYASKIVPAPGAKAGWIVGSIGSAGNDPQIFSRRLIFALRGTNAVAIWGGGAQVRFFWGTAPDSVFDLSPRASFKARSSVFVHRVVPGDYDLAEFGMERRVYGPWVASLIPDEMPRDQSFTLEEGEVVYVGEFLTAVASIAGVETAYVLHRDQATRDLEIAARSAPQIAGLRVKNLQATLAAHSSRWTRGAPIE